MTRIAYGTNVHPAEDLPSLLRMLDGPAAAVRTRVAPGSTLDLGLWIPGAMATALAGSPELANDVRRRLADNGLAIATVNAFPHGDFHADRVKENVYAPDWSDPRRLNYTIDVAQALAHLLEPGTRCVVSTSPGTWKDWDASPEAAEFLASGLAAAADALRSLRDETGVHVVVAPEPEPGCTLETVEEAVAFWNGHLAKALGDQADQRLPHLGLCADLCHLAVSERSPAEALGRLQEGGVPVAKVQVSAALEVGDPADADLLDALRRFDEPRWLHQCGCRDESGVLHRANDLSDVFADPETWQARSPWRIHFHAPLHRDEVEGVPTTRALTVEALRALAMWDEVPVLEVETYTWSAVPGFTGGDDELAGNIAAELKWVESILAE
ncbi:MAG: metabolite traffic protein EboE [Planctomycetota bacterium]